MSGEVLEIDQDELTAQINAEKAAQEFKDVWVMQNELCQTIANKHDPVNGVDLCEALFRAMTQQHEIFAHFARALDGAPELLYAPSSKA